MPTHININKYKKIPAELTDKDGLPVFKDSFFNPPTKAELLLAMMTGEEVSILQSEGDGYHGLKTTVKITGYKLNGVLYITRQASSFNY